jgi:serine/threonine protein kinase/beta-lactam-binding protein with PASTA domain
MQPRLLNNRYALDQKVGEGGMARVYRGRDARLNRTVAVKVLHPQYADDPGFLRRFQHEAQAAANLSHPAIVDVYDVGQDGDTHYIVMEYVDGRDLKSLINREAPLDIDRALGIAEAVANGLEAAHRLGLIHRDIKPQNIMVSVDGQVRITDFGIAKSHLSTALTETGVTFGTADYIAPEQAQGQPASPPSDIYALGVVLYEMLTGRLPFGGDNPVGVAMQHVSAPPPPLRRFNIAVSPQLEALVLRAMAKDPRERPQSAAEFAGLLHSYRSLAAQETMVGTARPPRPGPRPPVTRPTNGTTSPRSTLPPPRTTPAKAPRQQGIGCGGFVLVGLILVGVLGLGLLLTSGVLDGLIGTGGGVVTPPSATPGPSPTVTVTATPGPSPTPSPTPAPTVTVPNLVGQSEADALNTLVSLGLVPVADAPRNDPQVPEGVVLSQTVPAGSGLTQGQPVTYTLSLGPPLVSVPNLAQTRLSYARSTLAALGLGVDVIEEASPSVAEGFVIRQVPGGGVRLQPGDSVQLIVSVGDKVRMPRVVGLSEQEARARIDQAGGLFVSYVDVQGRDKLGDVFDQVAPGTVVSCIPTEGEWLARGTGVTLGVRAP